MQAVANHRVGRRPPTLAQDAFAACKTHDVVHRKEIHLEVQLRNQRQLVLHPLADVVRHALRVTRLSALLHVLAQGLRRRVAGQHRLQRVVVAQFIQAEMAALRHHQGVGQ